MFNVKCAVYPQDIQYTLMQQLKVKFGVCVSVPHHVCLSRNWRHSFKRSIIFRAWHVWFITVPGLLPFVRSLIIRTFYGTGSRSTFEFPVQPFRFHVCTVPNSMERTGRCNKFDAVRLYASYSLNLLLLKGQICGKTKFVFLI